MLRKNEKRNDRKIGTIYTEFLLIAGCLLIVYSAIYFVWARYYDYLLKREGQEVVATIISKDYYGKCSYDIEYDGIYYTNYTVMTKSAYRKVQVGERFPALVLPDKLKYHHESGITPKCFRMIQIPLPDYVQDIEKEQARIKKNVLVLCARIKKHSPFRNFLSFW